MFFAKIGEYKPCGIFTTRHFVFLFLTSFVVIVLLLFLKNKGKPEVRKRIRVVVITAWALEFFRIGYKLYCGEIMVLESYMPLFYCSIFLYAGILSAFAKGILKRAGDVTLMTGSLVGGVVFLIFPATSLLDYPAFHFVSVHSFLYHGAMVYIGLLMLMTKYIELKNNDVWLYAAVTAVLCLAALIINNIFDCNLMFISKGIPEKLRDDFLVLNKEYYTLLSVLLYLFLPYYIVYGINKKISAK